MRRTNLMKKWESPVIKVMSVKLNENIASSASNDGYTQQELYINGYYDVSSGTWKITGPGSGTTALYYVGSSGIQDTGYNAVSSYGLPTAPDGQYPAVINCRVG